jgi:hypothetical protein
MVPAMIRALLIVAVVACGGSKPTPTAPGGGDAEGSEGGACEPGRCLADISSLVKERRPAARACYDTAAKANPALPAGRIIINFRIDENGAVTETSQGMQDNQVEDEGVVTCIGDVIKEIKFAKSPSGKTTRAYHEFEFSRR